MVALPRYQYTTQQRYYPAATLEGVNEQLLSVLQEAIRTFPLKVEFTPHGGFDRGDRKSTSQHWNKGKEGRALDVQIFDASGKALPNYQSPSTYRVYKQFADHVRSVQQKTAPDLDKKLRWGGYFGGKLGGTYGAADWMHFDIGRTKLRGMAAGDFETGLSKEYQKAWGIPDVAHSRGLLGSGYTSPLTPYELSLDAARELRMQQARRGGIPDWAIAKKEAVQSPNADFRVAGAFDAAQDPRVTEGLPRQSPLTPDQRIAGAFETLGPQPYTPPNIAPDYDIAGGMKPDVPLASQVAGDPRMGMPPQGMPRMDPFQLAQNEFNERQREKDRANTLGGMPPPATPSPVPSPSMLTQNQPPPSPLGMPMRPVQTASIDPSSVPMPPSQPQAGGFGPPPVQSRLGQVPFGPPMSMMNQDLIAGPGAPTTGGTGALQPGAPPSLKLPSYYEPTPTQMAASRIGDAQGGLYPPQPNITARMPQPRPDVTQANWQSLLPTRNPQPRPSRPDDTPFVPRPRPDLPTDGQQATIQSMPLSFAMAQPMNASLNLSGDAFPLDTQMPADDRIGGAFEDPMLPPVPQAPQVPAAIPTPQPPMPQPSSLMAMGMPAGGFGKSIPKPLPSYGVPQTIGSLPPIMPAQSIVPAPAQSSPSSMPKTSSNYTYNRNSAGQFTGGGYYNRTPYANDPSRYGGPGSTGYTNRSGGA